MITWHAPEFEHRPKTAVWYWTSIVIAVALILIAIWQKNYFFALFAVIAEVLVLVLGSREPRMVQFKLDEKGLHIDGRKSFPFVEFRHWSVDAEGFFDPDYPDIIIYTSGHFHAGTHVKVPRALLPEVQEALRRNAKEVPFEPSSMDVLEKFLGF